jgi:hypothetical protein
MSAHRDGSRTLAAPAADGVPAPFAEAELRSAHGHFDRSIPLFRAAGFQLANTTPEADCAIDHVQQIRPDSIDEAWSLAQLRRCLTTGNRQLNLGRIDVEQGDSLVLTLAARFHAAIVTGDGGRSLKALAALLRPPLRILAAPAGQDAQALIDARWCARQLVRALCREHGADRLRCLEHELGSGPFRLLCDLLPEKTNGAQLGAAAVQGQEGSNGRFT